MFFEEWQDFLTEARKKKKKKRSRKSGAGLERSLKWFLDKGPQKKGGYPKKRSPNFKKKKFNDISAPPGAPGGLEEDSEGRPGYRKRIDRYTKDRDSLVNIGGQANTPPFTQKMDSHVTFDRQLGEEVEEESFEMNPELQPEIWHDNKMWAEVREHMLEIAEDFIEGLEMGIVIEDIRLTGSLANYNWSKYSDADVHILVDFAKIDEDVELVRSFFNAAKGRWNDLHDITIYGFEVELYVENTAESHHSSGIYSILQNEWVVQPTPRDVEIDFVTARKKSDGIETQVNLVGHMIAKGNLNSSLSSIERLKRKIRRLRQAGLDSPAKEFSAENIAFKILRRNGTLERLSALKYDTYDKRLSLPESVK